MLRVKADDERARLAEKRSIYARYMATLTGDLAAVTRLGAEKGASAELRDVVPLATAPRPVLSSIPATIWPAGPPSSDDSASPAETPSVIAWKVSCRPSASAADRCACPARGRGQLWLLASTAPGTGDAEASVGSASG